MKRIILVSLLILFLIVFTSSAFAQGDNPEPPTDDEVNAIAREMYCPVCENTPLDVCPTQACAEWRELIRDKLVEGWSEEQIEAYFVEQFGYRVLATPPARGLNWLIYLIPPLAFIAGVFLLIKVFRSMKPSELEEKSSVLEVDQASDQMDEAYYERIEKQLRNF